jgi:hypothetical protein
LARSIFVTLLKGLPIGIGPSLVAPAQAIDSNLYLIALAGQSNMTGAGDVRLLPASFPLNGPRIWNFTNADIWEPAREPIDSNDGQVDAVSRDKHPGVGPALAMADAFRREISESGGRPDPLREKRQQHREMGARPVALIALRFVPLSAKAGRAARQVARLGVLAGGPGPQGQETAKQWGKNFKKMVTAWRADVGDPKLPVILLVLKPGTQQTLRKYPYRDVVRQQQLSVQLPYLTKIETIGYDYNSDDIHLTTAGQLALGPVIAAALPAP